MNRNEEMMLLQKLTRSIIDNTIERVTQEVKDPRLTSISLQTISSALFGYAIACMPDEKKIDAVNDFKSGVFDLAAEIEKDMEADNDR